MAFDLDGTSRNSELFYSIKAITPVFFKNDGNSFELKKLSNDSNEIGLFKKAGINLDRDSSDIKDLIRIDIQVSDNGMPTKLTALKQIQIKLLDINDNFPMVLNSEQLKKIDIYENQELGKSILLIKVTKI
jgi:hypothetical protein